MTRRGPNTPLHSSLKSRPSCQTLSNALDISRKTARVSLDGNSSKAVYIYMQYVIDKSWLIVESPGRNPDWLGVSKSFSLNDRIFHQI